MINILTKLLGNGGDVADKLTGIADKFIQTKEEKDAFKKEMTDLFIKADIEMQKNITSRWQTDMQSDNKLSKSVRPAVLIFLIISTILLIFIDSGFINFAVDDEWKELLKLLLMTTVAAYFGGRSYEKGTKIKNK